MGFINYDNLLTRYDLDWGPDDPTRLFATDIHQRMMLKWGVGALIYNRDFYIGLSVPQIISNKFRADVINFSSLADVRYAYLLGGYFFGRQRQIRFKPTILVKGAIGEPVTADIAANWLFYDKFWVGAMYRTNNTAAIVTQFVMMKNMRFGYAMEFPFGREIFKYQLQTHEIRVVTNSTSTAVLTRGNSIFSFEFRDSNSKFQVPSFKFQVSLLHFISEGRPFSCLSCLRVPFQIPNSKFQIPSFGLFNRGERRGCAERLRDVELLICDLRLITDHSSLATRVSRLLSVLNC